MLIAVQFVVSLVMPSDRISRKNALHLWGTVGLASLTPLSVAPAQATSGPAQATITLNDGTMMPAIGYGTCCRPSAKGEPLIVSTKEFLGQGGRLIDTAQMYQNEAELGTAIKQSGLPRSEIWITDKVNTGPWVGDGPINTRAGTVASVRASLKALDTDYIDLMHIHGTWSIDQAEQIEVWRGLIEARDLGLVRRIGGMPRMKGLEPSHAPPSASRARCFSLGTCRNPLTPSSVHRTVHASSLVALSFRSLELSARRDRGDRSGCGFVKGLAE